MVYIVQTLIFCVYSTVTTSCVQGQDEGYVIGMYDVTITSNLYAGTVVKRGGGGGGGEGGGEGVVTWIVVAVAVLTVPAVQKTSTRLTLNQGLQQSGNLSTTLFTVLWTTVSAVFVLAIVLQPHHPWSICWCRE